MGTLHRTIRTEIPARVRERHRRARLASDQRAGARSQRALRRLQRRWIADRWHLIAGTFAMSGVLAALVHRAAPASVAPYVVGALLASTAWWIYTMMLEGGGLYSWRVGMDAERLTAFELRRLRRRGWYLVNHVMATKGDIDHALVGPGGSVAVETKFRSDWAGVADLRSIADQATRAARELEGRLGMWKPSAIPLVVAWGPQASERFPEPLDCAGVTFCAGAQVRDLIKRLPDVISEEQARAAFEKLDTYVRRRDIGEERAEGPLPMTLERGVVRVQATVGSAGVAALVVIAPARIYPSGLWCLLAAAGVCSVAGAARRRWTAHRGVRLAAIAATSTAAGLAALLGAAMLVQLV